MTNKEAIVFAESELKAAYERAEKIGHRGKTRYIEVLEMAIKALKELPKRRKEIKRWKRKALEAQESSSEKPNKSGKDNNAPTEGDYISRQAIIKYFNDEYHGMISDESLKIYQIIEIIRELPSVAIPSAEPQTGHWTRELIRNEKGGCIGAKMICSECNNDNKHDEYMNYCPNCGAKMERSDKE